MAKKKKNIRPSIKKVVKKTPVKRSNVKKNAKQKHKKPTPKKGKAKKVVKKLPPNKKKPSKKQTPVIKDKRGAGFASNNFNYIRALLWREYGLDYTGYSDEGFISIVKAVYTECKSRQRECSDKEIHLIYDEIRENPRRPFPEIREELYLNPRQYYELMSVELYRQCSFLSQVNLLWRTIFIITQN